MKTLKTVQDLINHLTELGPERILLIHDDGNTFDVTTDDVSLWDELAEKKFDDFISPVAINCITYK